MKCFKKIAPFLVVFVAILVSAEAQDVPDVKAEDATVNSIPDQIDINQNLIDKLIPAEKDDAIAAIPPSAPLNITIPESIVDTNIGLDDQAKKTQRDMLENIAARLGIVLENIDVPVDAAKQLPVNLAPTPLPSSAISDHLDSVREILNKNIATRTGFERSNSDMIVGAANSGLGAPVAPPPLVNRGNLVGHIDASNAGPGLNISRGNNTAAVGTGIRKDASISTTSTHNEMKSASESHGYSGGWDDGHIDTSAEVEDGIYLNSGNIEGSDVSASDRAVRKNGGAVRTNGGAVSGNGGAVRANGGTVTANGDDFGWATGLNPQGGHHHHHRHHRHRDESVRRDERPREDRGRGRDKDEFERQGDGYIQEEWNRQWRTENVGNPLLAYVQGLQDIARGRVQNSMLSMMQGGGMNGAAVANANIENRGAFRPRTRPIIDTNFNVGNGNFGPFVGPGFAGRRDFGIFGPPATAGFGNEWRNPLQLW